MPLWTDIVAHVSSNIDFLELEGFGIFSGRADIQEIIDAHSFYPTQEAGNASVESG